MLKKILIALLVLAALIVMIGFFLPATVHVERSITIDAPPATVFALANSFRGFNEWSPWAEIDPDAVYAYEGPDRGVGAKMSWTSEDRNVGSGSQEIVSSEPFSRVDVLLDFGDQGVADSYFEIAPGDAGTAVTWGFDSELKAPFERYLGLVMDSILGPMYEEGLANLKELAESLPKADWSDLDLEMIDLEEEPLVYTVVTSSSDHDAMAVALHEGFGKVMAFVEEHGLEMSGPPVAVVDEHTESSATFAAGIPVVEAPETEVPEDSPVKIGVTHAGTAIRATHIGPYADTPPVHEKIDAYIAAYRLETTGRPWEAYVSDPGNTPEEELVTHVIYPVE